MSPMHQAIEDGVGQGGVGDRPVPFTQGELRADHGRAPFVAIVDDLEQFAGLSAGKRGEPEVVKDEQIGLGEPGEEACP